VDAFEHHLPARVVGGLVVARFGVRVLVFVLIAQPEHQSGVFQDDGVGQFGMGRGGGRDGRPAHRVPVQHGLGEAERLDESHEVGREAVVVPPRLGGRRAPVAAGVVGHDVVAVGQCLDQRDPRPAVAGDPVCDHERAPVAAAPVVVQASAVRLDVALGPALGKRGVGHGYADRPVRY